MVKLMKQHAVEFLKQNKIIFPKVKQANLPLKFGVPLIGGWILNELSIPTASALQPPSVPPARPRSIK
jgi:hypothetical protein